MGDELQDLLEARVALDVARQRRRVAGVGDRAQREVHLLGRGRRRRARHRHLERACEALLEVRRSPSRLRSHSHASETPGSPR